MVEITGADADGDNGCGSVRNCCSALQFGIRRLPCGFRRIRVVASHTFVVGRGVLL